MSHGQRIRYLRTPDGVKLAWAEAGSGPVLVKAANWLTHLEYDWESPVWQHWIRFLGEHFRFVRYDERGCGMTDWNVGDVSFDRWVEDLEAVVDASEAREPFTLLGISQGASVCIAYAVRHPERVSRLILYGAYARGWGRRGELEGEREYNAIVELVRLGWGKDNPAFRQIFTSRFIPGGTDEQVGWFNELCRKTSSPAVAAELLATRAHILVTDLLARVHVPTLVIHAREDMICPIAEGRLVAAAIPVTVGALCLATPGALRGARPAVVRLAVTPPTALLDETVVVRVSGLRPDQEVVVRSSTPDGDAREWNAEASFRADAKGVVDLSTQAAASGSYTGVDAMGLFWSARTATPMAFPRPISGTIATKLEAGGDRKVVASATLARQITTDDINVTE